MATRRPEGTALLVAGHGALGALEASALHTLGQIGEALLATGTGWQIKRLAATGDARYTPDRGTLKQHLDELVGEPVRAAVVVLLGSILTADGEPALVTGDRAHDYPEDATLGLRWIRERLRAARAEQLVCVVSGKSDAPGDPQRWLAALAPELPSQLIAVASSDDDSHPIVAALLTALCGDALDPRTGTVTMASLSSYLARHAGASVHASESSETLAQPPPLAGLWDVRRSQLSMRATRPRAAPDGEDLTGTVLPGRFRIDSLVARGTFGTVYRARQLAVERDVAVKVLHAEIDPSSEDGRLFVHEIRSVGRIDHANVVGIHQADITQDGRLFFAMELLDGRDLQQLGADGPLPRARAVELTRQLLAGLGAAHDAGLVHADVKPANAIVIARDGEERVVLVDFGLARLRAPDRPAESAGGTPAYMAPEQMHLARVDARSDLFSAALVLVYLLTGWKRPNAFTPTPPFELIADADLRRVLERALELEPQHRYGSARELISALTGAAPTSAPPSAVVAPFRQLASFTEDDRGRLFGRESDVAAITQHALYRRSVIYAAPSGTGKTSLLRAGLLPRLEALGVQVVYLRCRPDSSAALAAAIWPEDAGFADARTVRARDLGEPAPPLTVASAIASRHRQRGGKLVLILDQVEAALGDDDFVEAALGFASWPADADVAVVLSIREDHLARLLARAQAIEPGMPVVRLPPLDPDGARAAIIGPLAEARLAIDSELLEVLLADLQQAASAIGPEMGWGQEPAVFPPHLQLACSVLYEDLAPGEATLTLAHYRRLGGFDAIVGEHLERVLDTELRGGSDKIARALFVALVTATHERAMRPESELIAMIGDAERAAEVLEVLRARGLVMRVRGDDGEPSWELAHDSLVPRVLAWIDAHDLARRRAIELVRHHLRRSSADQPSLLGRRELRELRGHSDAIVELDAEWKRRTSDEPWSPSRLVARSRQAVRRTGALISAFALVVVVALGIAIQHNREEARRRLAEEQQRLAEERNSDRDIGRFKLVLAPFDWDDKAMRPVPARPGALSWELYDWRREDDLSAAPTGPALDPERVHHGTPTVEGDTLVEHVEASGGRKYLRIKRGNCADSIVPIIELPGHSKRKLGEKELRIAVPTCEASLADTIEIPAGPFIFSGVGEPPSKAAARDDKERVEQEIDEPAYRIDRTEVTNAAFAVFGDMQDITGVSFLRPAGTPTLAHAGDARLPVSGLSWYKARAYCRFLGKDLQTSQQWVKAMRGGEILPGGEVNPRPRRNLPWGSDDPTGHARLLELDADQQIKGASAVGTHPGDRSPYGVLDLAGNLREWTRTFSEKYEGNSVVRGGVITISPGELIDALATQNVRAPDSVLYDIGVRCVISR